MQPTVTIGLPNYRRPRALARCIASLSGQTYSHIRILVADNNSEMQEVRDVLGDAQKRDPRIDVIYRPVNIGPMANFVDVLRRAETPLFIWSSNDDYWAPDAIQTLVSLLENHQEAQMACGSIIHFNNLGLSKRPVDLIRFASTGDRLSDLKRYLAAPEIDGKCQLFYGLFRTDALKLAADAIRLGEQQPMPWGEDILLSFAFLYRYNIVATDQPLMFKNRGADYLDPAPLYFSDDYSFPTRRYEEYLCGLLRGCATAEQRALTLKVMSGRLRWKRLVSSWRKPLLRRFVFPRDRKRAADEFG